MSKEGEGLLDVIARAWDAEDASQMGEPSPWDSERLCGEPLDEDWIKERRACASAVLTALDAADFVVASKESLDAKDARIADLRMQVRSCRCPHPVLADETIGACVDGGQCGCVHRDAASGAFDFDPLATQLLVAHALLGECETALTKIASGDLPGVWQDKYEQCSLIAGALLTKLKDRSHD